jgi:hypothetical protein
MLACDSAVLGSAEQEPIALIPCTLEHLVDVAFPVGHMEEEARASNTFLGFFDRRPPTQALPVFEGFLFPLLGLAVATRRAIPHLRAVQPERNSVGADRERRMQEETPVLRIPDFSESRHRVQMGQVDLGRVLNIEHRRAFEALP